MAKKNNNLICTRITTAAKAQLEYIKGSYGLDSNTKHYSKSDYAALGQLIATEYNRCMEAISKTI